MNETPRLLLLVGPTGTGKTAVAIELCHLLNGEVVSADSMQIYRGCDVVTAKASPAERAAVRHHLIDICEPHETYSAARWAEDAQSAINDIVARGKQPIIAGGTGFYIRALLEPSHLAAVPPDLALRAELEREFEAHGNPWMHQKLAQLDPDAATRLHPGDTHRVMRAIEIAVSGEQSVASGQNPAPNTQFSFAAFGLQMAREELYPRLEARVDAMLATGALDELRRLLDSGVPPDAPALQGVGYRQLKPVLENSALLPEAVELWKRDTRRYAKRQMTWFRHQLPTKWIEIHPDTNPADTAQQIAQSWRQQ